MLEPIELVTNKSGKLYVEPEALQILKKYDKPIKVVSIVGTYRTGKSYLLNRLMGRNDGFPLGSTVNSKTKGIWMWIGDHPGDSGRALLLLDTEGLNDVKKGNKTHDAKIFTLAILLSSIFVYNSKGTIDAQALEGLHVATELSSHIRTEQKGYTEFSEFFPSFIWALRDFHLELVDGEGRPITEKQYLEKSLRVDINSKANFMAVKQAVRDYFPERSCFAFGLPVPFKHLRDLETKKESDLDPEFLEVGQRFLKHVLESRSFMKLRGELVLGRGVALLAEQYVKHINEGSIHLKSVHDYMIKDVNQEAIKSLVPTLDLFMSRLKYPLSGDEFMNFVSNKRTELFEEFRRKTINLDSHPEYIHEFDSQCGDIVKKYDGHNKAVSAHLCLEKLDEHCSDSIDSKMNEGKYFVPGGYLTLRKDVDQLEASYKALQSRLVMGPSANYVHEKYFKDKVTGLRLYMFMTWL